MKTWGVNITLTGLINSNSNMCKRDKDIMMLGTFSESFDLVQNGVESGELTTLSHGTLYSNNGFIHG